VKYTCLIIPLFVFSICAMAQTASSAQPVAAANTGTVLPLSLPAINIVTEMAENKLSWYCQFDGVKSIAVQRSADSVRNFATIGVINTPKKGNGTYKDLHPMIGKNYYRLSIEFGGDMEWFSNTGKAMLDSAMIAKTLEVKAAEALAASEAAKTLEANAAAMAAKKAEREKALKALKEEAALSKPKMTSAEVKAEKRAELKETVTAPAEPVAFSFVPSAKIFTNPYTGHVNIKLADALSRRYNIRFYDPAKNEVLRISRVSKPSLILDKNNFNSRGIYSFQLFDGTTLVESGYVNIY